MNQSWPSRPYPHGWFFKCAWMSKINSLDLLCLTIHGMVGFDILMFTVACYPTVAPTVEFATVQQLERIRMDGIRKQRRLDSGLRNVCLIAYSALEQMVTSKGLTHNYSHVWGHTHAYVLQHSIIFGLAVKHSMYRFYFFSFFLTF